MLLLCLSSFQRVIVEVLLTVSMWNVNHVKASCIFLRREQRQREVGLRWGGVLHSTFFISSSTFFFIPCMCFCCVTHRLRPKTQVALQSRGIWKTYGAIEKATAPLAPVCSVTSWNDGGTDGTCWFGATGSCSWCCWEIYTCRSLGGRGLHQKWATAEGGWMLETNASVELCANETQ